MTHIHVYMYTIIRFSTGPRCLPRALCPDPPPPPISRSKHWAELFKWEARKFNTKWWSVNGKEPRVYDKAVNFGQHLQFLSSLQLPNLQLQIELFSHKIPDDFIGGLKNCWPVVEMLCEGVWYIYTSLDGSNTYKMNTFITY